MASSFGSCQPAKGAAWSSALIFCSSRAKVMQRVEHEVLALVGAWMTCDHLDAA